MSTHEDLREMRERLAAWSHSKAAHWSQCPKPSGGECSCAGSLRERNDRVAADAAMLADVTAHVAALEADNDRLRTRIHEAVNECQKRHAPYVSRCAQLDQIVTWARVHMGDSWARNSVAANSVVMASEERARNAEAEVERLRALVGDETPEEERGGEGDTETG